MPVPSLVRREVRQAAGEARLGQSSYRRRHSDARCHGRGDQRAVFKRQPDHAGALEETAKRFHIVEVSADKAYASENNFQAIAKLGRPRSSRSSPTRPERSGGLFAKAFHFFNLHRDVFLAHYHKRSNVESAIMSIKTKFGDCVRSKTDRAMRNEVLCKILCHNLCCLIDAMHELGIAADFAAAPAAVDAHPQLA